MANAKSKAAVVVTVEVCAAGIISAYESNAKSVSVGAEVAKAIAELFVIAEAEGRFDEFFGNGKLGKENTPGSLKQSIDAKIAKMHKDKRDGILKMLKVRLSEARKLHRLEGTPAKGEGIQAALKRYAKAPVRKAKPEGNETESFAIPEELSADKLADALSHWLAAQTPAKANALAEDIKDMFKPVRKTAAKKTAA